MKKRVDLVIQGEVEQRDIKIKYIESLIKHYEELYKIELNKKAIVKDGYDQIANKTSVQFS